MAEKAAKSSLFGDKHIEVIPYPIDLATFHPVPKTQARSLLGLDASKPTVLFVAMSATTDPRKGFDLFDSTMAALKETFGHVQIIVVGSSAPPVPTPAHSDFRFLGLLRDDTSMVLAYSAADVFVTPSRRDNLPNTVIESLACGTPVAAFRVGGLPDIIDNMRTGFLAEPYDTRHLAEGIRTLLDVDRRHKLSNDARTTAEERFSPHVVSARYTNLYEALKAGEA
jgi:glycosyltransferase involved in cell wall biosynthesis